MPRISAHLDSLKFVLSTAALVAASVGCTPLAVTPKPPTAPTKMAKNGVVLDVLFVRFPLGEADLNETVWQEIDELNFAPDVRRRLESNGFRAGLISGAIPHVLEKRLNLHEKIVADDGPKTVDIDATPTAKQKQMHVLGGRRANILVMGEKERRRELAVLLRSDDGRVEGKTYHDVLGLFALRAHPLGDGGVRLDLVPELEHGESQKRFVPGDGMFRVEFGPPHEVIDALRCAARLAPGQILAVSTRSAKPGTLGYQFFTEADGESTMQKMLLVRLAHCEFDDRFSEGKIAPTEE
jgi:hypothetical protein